MSTKHYGQTDSEASAKKSLECREIVATILDFGVNQNQILKIIKLLSLELINRDHMLSIAGCLDEISTTCNEEERKIICND